MALIKALITIFIIVPIVLLLLISAIYVGVVLALEKFFKADEVEDD